MQELVQYVARGTNRRAAIVGDIAEAINPLDKRFEQEQHKIPITEQYKRAKDMFWPIRRKILFANSGNHDSKIRTHGDCVRDVFCDNLKIPYGTVSCKLIVSGKDGKLMYKAFATHPHSGVIRSSNPDPIMREASEKSQLKRRLARERMADCILNVAAHYHKAIVVKPYQDLYLVDDGDRIKQRYIAEAHATDEYIDENLRWYASVPGWIKKYGLLGTDGYTERAGYDPLPLGAIKTVVQGGKIVEMEKMLV